MSQRELHYQSNESPVSYTPRRFQRTISFDLSDDDDGDDIDDLNLYDGSIDFLRKVILIIYVVYVCN